MAYYALKVKIFEFEIADFLYSVPKYKNCMDIFYILNKEKRLDI